MDLKEVRDTVALLNNHGKPTDNEMAHEMEDDLYIDVLKEVVAGNPEVREMAKEALKTQTFDFTRWYA